MANENETSSVRVHPWVSYVVGLLLLVGSFAILLAGANTNERASESPEIQAAVRAFERNPEVEVSARFAGFIGTDNMAEVRERHAQRRDQGGVAVLSKRMQRKSQKRFDEAQRAAFASLQDLPTWRFGLVDSSSPLANTATHLVVNETALAIAVSMVFFVVVAIALEGAWGSLLFGALCLMLPVVTRVTYTSLYGGDGVPWIGASGMLAGLLGAYLVRSFGGFTIPGWLLLPVWITGEYLLARDLPIDHFDPTPVVMHGVCFAFGGVFAAALWVLGLEDKLRDRQLDTPELMSNPAVEEALQQREKGNVEAAFDLLDEELRRRPSNHDAALALWQVASGTDLVNRAMPALLGSLRDSLRGGRKEDACALWLGIASQTQPRAESTLMVRIAEALLSQEEHEAALQAFGWAVNGPKPLSSVLALRVVRGSKDLDRELAGRAAAVALIDDQLGASERAAMQRVVDAATVQAAASPEGATAEARPAATPAPKAAPAATSEPAAPAPEPDPFQDPNALAEDAFAELADGESLAGEDPDSWNQPGMVEDLSAELEDDAGGFDWSGLQDDASSEEIAAAVADVGLSESDIGAAGDAVGEEDDTDVEFGETANELAVEGADLSDTTDSTDPIDPTDSSDTTDTTETTETTEALGPKTSVAEPTASVGSDLHGSRRSLRARSAVPVSLDNDGIFLEIEGGEKTHLAFSRIEAVAAGAVRGLADKPVLIVDLVLNWLDVPDEPLKVVRLRSDGFDPRRVVPDRESALDSLRAMLDRLIAASGATPLPGRDSALGNPFENFPDAASYDRDVLMAE